LAGIGLGPVLAGASRRVVFAMPVARKHETVLACLNRCSGSRILRGAKK
jgi:hypothetical protein